MVVLARPLQGEGEQDALGDVLRVEEPGKVIRRSICYYKPIAQCIQTACGFAAEWVQKKQQEHPLTQQQQQHSQS